MKDYALIANTTNAFPNVISNNVTAPGSGDGTPYVKDFIDDLWGHSQDLMARAGLVPSGSSEAASSSQRTEALKRIFGAPGELVLWHGQADPAVAGLRMLILQGQGVLRTSYPDLDAACYIGDGNNGDVSYPAYYHADDPAGTIRNIAGDYLILSECRGLFLRGWDPSAINDEHGATRKFPDKEFWSMSNHTHEIFTSTTGLHAKYQVIDKFGSTDPGLSLLAGATGDRLRAVTITTPSAQYLSLFEVRAQNFAAKICVRY